MNQNNKLASQLAVGLALATLFGTSAFAESRHSNETRQQGTIHRSMEGRTQVRSEQRSEPRSEQRSYRNRDESRNDANGSRSWDRNRSEGRSYDRNRSDDNNRRYDNNNRNYDRNRSYDNRRSYDNNRDSRRYDSNRSDRRYDSNRYDRRGSYDRHTPYYAYGRVTRLERYGGGYRCWIGGAAYPFFIPDLRFRLFPLRVGLNIRIGGYYNPLGYYDYYDAGPYSGQVYTNGNLRGVVESVDYRRGTLVLRDDLSGSFVTVLLARGDRLMDDLRPGDYVDFTGAWSRNGVFDAYRVADLDTDGYRR